MDIKRKATFTAFCGVSSASGEPAVTSQSKSGLLLASVAALASGMILMARREQVVRAFPASAGAYAAIGLPINLRGLELRNVRSKLLNDGGQKVLTIEGDIANITPNGGKVPDIQVSVRNSAGLVIYTWNSPAPKSELSSGESIYFRARLAAPPAEANDVKLQFAEAEPIVRKAIK